MKKSLFPASSVFFLSVLAAVQILGAPCASADADSQRAGRLEALSALYPRLPEKAEELRGYDPTTHERCVVFIFSQISDPANEKIGVVDVRIIERSIGKSVAFTIKNDPSYVGKLLEKSEENLRVYGQWNLVPGFFYSRVRKSEMELSFANQKVRAIKIAEIDGVIRRSDEKIALTCVLDNLIGR